MFKRLYTVIPMRFAPRKKNFILLNVYKRTDIGDRLSLKYIVHINKWL